MWQSVELACVTASALVFAIAGAVKLKEEKALLYRLLGGAELLTAAASVLPMSRVVGLAGGAVLGLGFTAYAVAAVDRPCRCFGARLQATSRNARVIRAFSVSALTALGLASWHLAGSSMRTHWSDTAIVLGLVLGVSVVVLPWFLSPTTEGSEGPMFKVADHV